MAITNTSNKKTFKGGQGNVRFDFDFSIASPEDIKVIITDLKGQNRVLTKDYIVDMENRVVIYPGYIPEQTPPEILWPSPLPQGYKLTLIRETPLTQEVNLGLRHPLPVIENMGDKLTMMIQDMKEEVDRSIKVGLEATGEDFEAFREYADSAISSAGEAAKSAAKAHDSELSAKVSAQQAYNSAASINAMAANSWDDTTYYNYPDLVVFHDGNTYRCIGNNIMGEEPADSLNWVRVTFAGAEAEKIDNLVFLNKNIARNTPYQAGDVAYSTSIPSWGYFEAITSGVTADYLNPAEYPQTENAIFVDGSVAWRLRKFTQNDTIVKNTEPANAPQDSIWVDTQGSFLKIKGESEYNYFFPKTRTDHIVGIDKYAKLDGATFTATPKAPSVNNQGQIDDLATIFDIDNALLKYASLNSPVFTGTPIAPAPDEGVSNNQIATTGFVKAIFDSVDKDIRDTLVSNPGYMIFKSGLIVQWGNVVNGSTNGQVIFPMAFKAGIFYVGLSDNKNANDNTGYPTVTVFRHNNLTTSGFICNYYVVDWTGMDWYVTTVNSGIARNFYWLAIGY